MNYPTDTDNALSFDEYKKVVNSIKQDGFSLDVKEGATAADPYIYSVLGGSAHPCVPNPKAIKRSQLTQAELQELLEECAGE